MHMDEKSRAEPMNGRRAFMKKIGGATALAAGTTVLPKTALSAVTKKKIQYGMVIDTRRCIGCHACTVACKSEFDVPLGVNRSWVEYTEKGTFPNVDRSFLPRLCNHCSEPPCVSVCPTGATWKREDNGTVVIDPDICIGCKYCIQACPYGARFLNPVTGVADKCDFCEHRTNEGIEPSCVNTCIGKARIFGDINDHNSEVSKRLAENPTTVLRHEMGTQPNVFYIAAETTDEHDMKYRDEYIRVTTHRKDKKRV
jgi:tetrathionate reductase subunit B